MPLPDTSTKGAEEYRRSRSHDTTTSMVAVTSGFVSSLNSLFLEVYRQRVQQQQQQQQKLPAAGITVLQRANLAPPRNKDRSYLLLITTKEVPD